MKRLLGRVGYTTGSPGPVTKVACIGGCWNSASFSGLLVSPDAKVRDLMQATTFARIRSRRKAG